MRLRWLSLVLLLLTAGPASAQFSGTAGKTATAHPCLMSNGSSCYADFTANGSAGFTPGSASRISVRVICNLANASDNDCSVTVASCPGGLEAYDALVCRAMPYQDINRQSQTVLNGDLSTWREMAEFSSPARVFVVVETANQTTRVQVDGR